jgi:hypothetical protein
VWFAAAYWYEKWELLKLSRRPVAYGGALSSSINHMVPFATVSACLGEQGAAGAERQQERAGG